MEEYSQHFHWCPSLGQEKERIVTCPTQNGCRIRSTVTSTSLFAELANPSEKNLGKTGVGDSIDLRDMQRRCSMVRPFSVQSLTSPVFNRIADRGSFFWIMHIPLDGDLRKPLLRTSPMISSYGSEYGLLALGLACDEKRCIRITFNG